MVEFEDFCRVPAGVISKKLDMIQGKNGRVYGREKGGGVILKDER
jgi:hypothetical protein